MAKRVLKKDLEAKIAEQEQELALRRTCILLLAEDWNKVRIQQAGKGGKPRKVNLKKLRLEAESTLRLEAKKANAVEGVPNVLGFAKKIGG